MSVTKGILALLVVIGVFVALLNQIVPKEAKTPERATNTWIGATDSRAAQGADHRIEIANEVKLRPDSNVTAVSMAEPQSPLMMLITAKGRGCARVTAVVPVRAGDGVYAITCNVGAGAQRYIVDTRGGSVTAA